MFDEGKTNSRKTQSGGGNVLPALCNVLGTLMIIIVIALCVPITVPWLVGFQVYDVVSGSMEPEIPVGSVVYVKQTDPSTIQVGDVVAYEGESGIVIHRVTTNRTSMGEMVTKGDANNVEDLSPVPYDNVLGRVELHLPFLGAFMSIYASIAGKVYLLLVAACGVMLNLVASSMRKRRREGVEGEATDSSPSEGGKTATPAHAAKKPSHADDAAKKPSHADGTAKKRSRAGGRARKIIVVVLLVVFLGSGGVIAYVNWQYALSDSLYNEAFDDFAESQRGVGKVPITVDFASLQAKYPDVVGWLYCEGTPINYPVMRGRDNDYYLSHDYTGEFNINGSIFVDQADILTVDSKAVVYGHHMQSGSMFASLLDWASQEYYDEHPIMWLLTPTQDYKVELFSGHHTNAQSNLYNAVHEPGDELNAYLASAKSLSDFVSDVKLDPNAKYIMMSTCAYLFDDDRYVLHGMLTPVKSL